MHIFSKLPFSNKWIDIIIGFLSVDRRQNTTVWQILQKQVKQLLREKGPNTELFLVRIFLYSELGASALK